MTGPRFPVRFSGANKAMALLGMRAATSYVEVGDDTVVVRMGPYFRAVVPRAQVSSAAEDHDAVWGWGVHGWAGTWLLNGSSAGLVRITIDPAARAHALGLPIRLRVLRVAVADPAGLLAALSAPVPA